MYTPKKTELWAKAAALYMRREWKLAPFDGAVRLEIVAVHPRPKTRPAKVSRELWASGERLPRRGTPDWDNIGKAVCDAMNGLVLVDDADVVDGRTLTMYAAQGEASCVEITMWHVAT